MLAIALLLAAATPIQLVGEDYQDLAPLGSAIGKRTIVELGEATHGAAEFYQLKLRLVRYLHEKRGFNVLAIEAGMMETGMAALRRNELTDREWMVTTMSGGMRWREMLPLFAYLKSRPKLRVIGIDPQFSATEVLDYTHDAVAPYRPKLAAQIRQRLGEPYQYQALHSTDAAAYAQAEADYVRWLDAVQAQLEKIRPELADASKFAILRRGFAGLRDYYQGAAGQTQIQRFQARDRVMAENLLAQIDKDRVIVWAHNGHIGRGIGFKVVGDHLRQARPKDVFGLGLFGRTGEWREHWSGQTKPWEFAPDGIENRFPSGQSWFSTTTAMTKMITAYEPENGGRVAFDPNQRFDGLIVVDKLTPTNRP